MPIVFAAGRQHMMALSQPHPACSILTCTPVQAHACGLAASAKVCLLR
jgi:hypothetical protein